MNTVMNGQKKEALGAGVMLLMIAASCLLLANLYYSQPVLAVIASSLHLAQDAAGSIVMAAQLGYIAGLLFLAPLGDVLENRKLCAGMTLGASLSALASAWAGNAPLFLFTVFLTGLFATATQILVVFAVSLGGVERSGRILGIMACGLFLGIAASRPFSSFITGLMGWRAVYLISGIALLVCSGALFYKLPAITPQARQFNYATVLLSMIRLVRHPGLLRNTAISSGVFFSFIMFWSCMPMHLTRNLGYSQNQVTIFTLAGLITPPCMLLVGKLLDKGVRKLLMLTGLSLIIIGWLTPVTLPGSIFLLFLAALMLDPSSSAVTVSVQQKILSNSPLSIRGRLNSLNISMNFLGGASGGALGPWILGNFGLPAVVMTATGLICILICLTATSK